MKLSISATLGATLALIAGSSVMAQMHNPNVVEQTPASKKENWNSAFVSCIQGSCLYRIPSAPAFVGVSPSPSGSCKSASDKAAPVVPASIFSYSKYCTQPGVPGCPGTSGWMPEPVRQNVMLLSPGSFFGNATGSSFMPVCQPQWPGGPRATAAPWVQFSSVWHNGRGWMGRGPAPSCSILGSDKVVELPVEWGTTSTFWPTAARFAQKNAPQMGQGLANLHIQMVATASIAVARDLPKFMDADTPYCRAGFVDSKAVLP
jgi:hypothetical protein